VVLEVTERSITDLDALIREAERLRRLGFKLALDDAGSGTASLNVLSRLHVDFVKIDRGVVTRARTDPSARAVLAGIIVVAREMHAFVIAEGIETVETLEMVHDIAVSNGAEGESWVLGMQGYLLGRPESEFLREEILRDGDGMARQGDGVRAFLQGAQTARRVSTVM
jgi:EAL domain-containing protein (putative c-di-GMP-specific phosphodiesterase class I)